MKQMEHGVGTKTAVKIFNIMTNKYIGLISVKTENSFLPSSQLLYFHNIWSASYP